MNLFCADILQSFGIELTSDDEQTLLLKYDLKNNNTVCYKDFIRHFVVRSQISADDTSLLTRRHQSGTSKVICSFIIKLIVINVANIFQTEKYSLHKPLSDCEQ